MTLQQTFDTVAAHLLAQNFKAEDEHGACKYRGPTGLKCAAGCLIPDELYTDEMDSQGTITSTSLVGRLLVSLGHDFELVRSLQCVHDQWNVAQWPHELALVAQKFSLQPQLKR